MHKIGRVPVYSSLNKTNIGLKYPDGAGISWIQNNSLNKTNIGLKFEEFKYPHQYIEELE